MKLVYAIFDRKSEAYGPLFAVPHDAVAMREFGAALETPQSTLAKYPDDFELHRLGVFADAQAPGSPPLVGDVPVVVITAVQWLAGRNAQSGGQLSLIKEG